MNGRQVVTSGGPDVTSGERFEWQPFLIVTFFTIAIAFVNVASDHTEIARAGLNTSRIEPWIWSFTSAPIVIALAPAIGMIVRKFPPAREGWLGILLVHLCAATAFSAVHIAAMVALRELAYLALPWGYDFTDGGLVTELLYEWRKDLVSYAYIAGGYWVWRSWRAAEARSTPKGGAPGPLRIEVRDGSKVMLLDAEAIGWIEAAGNYVEIHTANGMHTARGTLASYADRLETAGFVRIHRSRLVNPARVGSYETTPSGDVEIVMSDGARLVGSRRFRAALSAALTS